MDIIINQQSQKKMSNILVISGKIALGEKGILPDFKKNDSFSKNSLGGKA
jgi:hypothetical protein